MKTYELFVEATEADLKAMGASASQIAMLKKRQEKRGKGFSTGDDRVSKTPSKSTPKALPGSSALAKRPESRGVGSFDKPGALALRPANKATAIVKAKAAKKDVDLKSQVRKAPKVDKFKPKPTKPTGGKGFGKKMPGGWDADGSADRNWNKNKTGALASAAGKGIKRARRTVGDFVRDSVKMTSKAGPGVAHSKDLKGPMKGIYGASSKPK